MRLKSHVCSGAFALLLAMLTLAPLASISGPTTPEATAKMQKAAKSRGNDPNIKQDNVQGINRVKHILLPSGTQPPEKGGTGVRGSSTMVKAINYTGYFIQVYLNGIYRGTLGPYGDASFYLAPGYVQLYARAHFDDDTYASWGPSVSNLTQEAVFNWKLTE